MTLALAAAGPRAYWYLTRGSGVVALLLLTAAVLLGLLDSQRFSLGSRWPRFTIDRLHRDVSLLVLVVLVVHILTGVLDGFAPIRLIDAVIPFGSTYRPLWIGLGALAFDLLLAVALTSLIRRRLGFRAWRAVHWLAYASWPVAVLHGLGTGSDTKAGWSLALTVACVAVVVAAVVVRILRARGAATGVRAPALALAAVTPVGLAAFALLGPLQAGWARHAGTPATLLGPAPAVRSTGTARTPATATAPAAALTAPFSAQLSGQARQQSEPGGTVVDLALALSGGAQGELRVRIAGTPLGGGGLSMTGSQVDLTAAGLRSVMQGQIVSLQGQQFVARVRDTEGKVMDLQASLEIDQNTNAVSGTLSATPAGSP